MTGPAPLTHPWPEPPAPGEALEVADGVLWFRLPLPMAGLDHVNIYALADDLGDPAWTLIDTGMAWPKGRAAMEAMLTGPLAGRPGLARAYQAGAMRTCSGSSFDFTGMK